MQLSKRLIAVANMVTSGLVLADIGTDHAYIPIYLVEKRVIPHAIAADVNRGPLLRAEAHIREHGLQDRIETRLSDGLTELRPGEAQSILIAGMGGALTVRILQNGTELLKIHHEMGNLEISELILQPQSEIALVRGYLAQSGWEIVLEDMVFEDGKYYPMMKAKRTGHIQRGLEYNGRDAAAKATELFSAVEASENDSIPYSGSDEQAAMSDLQLEFGPKLLEVRHPVLREYLLREQKTQERILESLRKGKSEMAGAREQEIHEKMQLIEEALRLYE